MFLLDGGLLHGGHPDAFFAYRGGVVDYTWGIFAAVGVDVVLNYLLAVACILCLLGSFCPSLPSIYSAVDFRPPADSFSQ